MSHNDTSAGKLFQVTGVAYENERPTNSRSVQPFLHSTSMWPWIHRLDWMARQVALLRDGGAVCRIRLHCSKIW